jgi:hypothetical protein
MKTALYTVHNKTKRIPSCLYDFKEVSDFKKDYLIKDIQCKNANVVMWDLFQRRTRHPIETESFAPYWTRGNECCSIVLVALLREFFLFEKNNMRSVLWDITPCNPSKVNRRFGETCSLHEADNKLYAGLLLGLLLFNLKLEAICSSETSIDFQRTIRLYIPGDRAFHNHSRENPKSLLYVRIPWSHKANSNLVNNQWKPIQLWDHITIKKYPPTCYFTTTQNLFS